MVYSSHEYVIARSHFHSIHDVMSGLEHPKGAPRRGKRPSDAISISDDEEPSCMADPSKSDPDIASRCTQLTNPFKVYPSPLVPSSTNIQLAPQKRRLSNKKVCNSKELDQDVGTSRKQGTHGIANTSTLVCGGKFPQQVANHTPSLEQSNGFRDLTFWRRKEGKFWTHELYCGPNDEKVKIYYCKTRAESERVAALLASEPVLGFDMEWKPRGGGGIKNNISLIQLACEDQIALFHLALHEGRTVNKLLAPTLCKILESPNIIKTGVAILRADGRRLQKYMKLEPRGFFELSYLHRLVKYHRTQPEKVNKQLVSLAGQVFEHLGKPLFKGKVRVSDWTKPLDSDQIKYSAADAYAGFRLFHAMEMKRVKFVPVPPRPAFAELDLPIELFNEVEPSNTECNESVQTIAAKTSPSATRRSNATKASRPPEYPTVTAPALENGPVTRRALLALRGLRVRLSEAIGIDPSSIASDTTLEELAAKRPKDRVDIENVLDYKEFSRIASQKGVDMVEFLHMFERKMAQ